jgi:flagellar biosynthetic protein FliO
MRIIVVLLSFVPYTVFAQDTLNSPLKMPDMNYSPGIASIIFKLILSLVVIVGLIYLTVYMLKKIGNKGLPSGEGIIKVVSKSYLTPKQSLFIVKLGSTYSVIGVGDNSVSHIKDLPSGEVETVEASYNKAKGFQNVFKSVLGK